MFETLWGSHEPLRLLLKHRAVSRLLLAAALVAVASSIGGGDTVAGTLHHGRTVTFAEQAGSPPQYISPMASAPWYANVNVADFSQLLYRPLFWFGDDGQPVFNPALSVAYAPKWSDRNQTLTVRLKHWIWSDGEPITARDVVFWMNLLVAAVSPQAASVGSSSAPGPGYGAYVPGEFPDNVASYRQTGTYTLVFHLDSSYNPTWFLYNELSQITPVPQHVWDKLSATGVVGNYDEQGIGTATSGALGVAQFINSQSEDAGTYTIDPLWKVVSGPFKLVRYTSAGFVRMVPNAKYSGPDKAKITAFEEIPFTSDAAEFAELQAGDLTVGYVPVQDLSRKPYLAQHGYSFSPWYTFGISYLSYNFTAPTSGPIFKQLYFRQAFQRLVNQPLLIREALGGYGTSTDGPVPVYPSGNADLTTAESTGRSVAYDPSDAVGLLKDNGWRVVPGGTTSCIKPGTGTGECGAGIAAGTPLSFRLVIATDSPELVQEVGALKVSVGQAGIQLNYPTTCDFCGVIPYYPCTTAAPCAAWDISDLLSSGWVYSPDYLPTGEQLFRGGASSDYGDYSDQTVDHLIQETISAPASAEERHALSAYENYLAEQLPVIWLPNLPYQLTVFRSYLRGVVPQGVFGEIYPEDYRVADG